MRLAVLLLCAALAAACSTTRSPLEVTAARLAEAPTPEARAAAVAERLHDAGTAPLGDGRVRPLPTDVRLWQGVAGGLVAGQRPGWRDSLVTLATPLDGPFVAEVVEAARVLAASRPHGVPHRSVLVAVWPAGLPVPEGLAAVARLPVWSASARTATLVVGGERTAGTERLDPEGATGEALVARIAAVVLSHAAAPPDTTHRPSAR